MKQTCLDCKYYINNKCTHVNTLYCKNAELWTPKWYKNNKLEPMLMQLAEPEYMCPKCGYKFYVYNETKRPNKCEHCNLIFKWENKEEE